MATLSQAKSQLIRRAAKIQVLVLALLRPLRLKVPEHLLSGMLWTDRKTRMKELQPQIVKPQGHLRVRTHKLTSRPKIGVVTYQRLRQHKVQLKTPQIPTPIGPSVTMLLGVLLVKERLARCVWAPILSLARRLPSRFLKKTRLRISRMLIASPVKSTFWKLSDIQMSFSFTRLLKLLGSCSWSWNTPLVVNCSTS